MQVTEIFRSIQGEGTRAGLPCIFVRLTGCNLRCVWCDTAYAFYGGEKTTLDQVMSRVRELSAAPDGGASIRLVEITGGEPLLQPETPALAQSLVDAGYTVMIETSGERPIHALPREVIKIVDVKCPDSGEADSFRADNLGALSADDEVKFVISTRRDYEFSREFLQKNNLHGRVRQIIFSPVTPDPAGAWQGLEARQLAEWILADGLPVRLGLQLHKFIWDPAARGV